MANINKEKEFLLFTNKFKKELIDKLAFDFNLLQVDPIYIDLFNENVIGLRTINFDNCLNNNIYSFIPRMDLYLVKYFYYLNYDLYTGIICEYFHFNRDYRDSNITNYQYRYLTINYRIRVEDNNEKFILNFLTKIFLSINKIIVSFSKNKKINLLSSTIRSISQKELKKMYPLLKQDIALKQYLIEHTYCLFFNNKNLFKNYFNIGIDNQINDLNYADIYLNYSKVNLTLNLGNVYINPTRSQVHDVFSFYPVDKNILVINLNITYLLMYILGIDNIAYLNIK